MQLTAQILGTTPTVAHIAILQDGVRVGILTVNANVAQKVVDRITRSDDADRVAEAAENEMQLAEQAKDGTLADAERTADHNEMLWQPPTLLHGVIATLDVMLDALEGNQPKAAAISLGRRGIALCRTELALVEAGEVIDPRPFTGDVQLREYPDTEAATAQNTRDAVDRVKRVMGPSTSSSAIVEGPYVKKP